jgi:O-antigen/teichoic acid export membrane protein
MGIVARQSIISSISAYLGVAIGYLNIVILMPMFMSKEEIGLFRTIIAISILFVPFALFGSSQAVLKFYPKFKERIPQLLGFLVVSIVAGFSIVFVASIILQEQWYALFEARAERVNEYFYLIYALLFLMVLFNFFEAISKSNFAIILPNFLRDFFYKSIHAGLIILIGFGLISFDQYLYGHVWAYIVLCIILGIQVIRKFNISISFKGIFDASFYREILNFTSFSFLGGFSIILVLQIDQIMVTQLLGLDENGVYTTALFMALVVELPRRYVVQIISPFISRDLHDGDYQKINVSYKKTSEHLIWLGGLLFILITLNLRNIFGIMPNGEQYSAGWWVVYLVGATKLVDMLFSVNGEIISISKYYRFNVILVVILGILTVITNLLFIPIFGIEGAALATLLTYLVFNIIKYFLLKIKFRLDPFSNKTIWILVYMVAVYFGVRAIPHLDNYWIDLFARSFIIVISFVASIYIVRPSEETIEITNRLIRRLKNI